MIGRKHIKGYVRIGILALIVMLVAQGCGNQQKQTKEETHHPEKGYQATEHKEVSNNLSSNVPHLKEGALTDVEKLKQAFESKDTLSFIALFPSDFEKFMEFFGWQTATNQPSDLYEESYAYIDYFFTSISQEPYHKFEAKLIDIAKNGYWQADAVNYFQDMCVSYIKNKQGYYLIDKLSPSDAKSVLFFLFDNPHPTLDTDFAAQLSPSKKEILEELYVIGFYDDNENPDPISPEDLDPMDYEGSIHYNISDFEDSEHFFIRDIDINKDGVLDKIVSADPYQGNELFLFIKKENEYQFALKTTNFSEDGGNQIVDLTSTADGFVIQTAFPDGGVSKAYHHIAYLDTVWVLTHTVYKFQSSHQEDAFLYVCNVVQDIHLDDEHLEEKLQWIPDEEERNGVCTKEML